MRQKQCFFCLTVLTSPSTVESQIWGGADPSTRGYAQGAQLDRLGQTGQLGQLGQLGQPESSTGLFGASRSSLNDLSSTENRGFGGLSSGGAFGSTSAGKGAFDTLARMNTLGGLGGLQSLSSSSAAVAESTLHRAFHYGDIAAHLLQAPADFSKQVCKELCVRNTSCAAWEVCSPLGDGCDGCYLVGRAPRRFNERPNWHAEVLPGREDLGWDQAAGGLENLTIESCEKFVLEANGADESQGFHTPENMQKYTICGTILRDHEKPRDVALLGQHWPTVLLRNFWDPPVQLPREVEQEMLSNAVRSPRRAPAPVPGSAVTLQLHDAVGTRPWEEHLEAKPRGPHAFILPFFDTNIGHWMKQHGSMNPLQSYEMQSLLQAGDTVLDVGANLGCYTIPFAERVGATGKVIAFEPFRWLRQLVAGNVALNGLSNVWLPPIGLGSSRSSFEARPPQLRFFSSPGGVKLQQQQAGLKQEEVMQLYDWDSAPERVTVLSLDELFGLDSSFGGAELLGLPQIDDIRLMKIDVEGMEKEVLAGARLTVRRFKPIIWTENVAYFSSQGQDTSFLRIMDELEYACSQAQNAPNDIVCMDRNGRGHQI